LVVRIALPWAKKLKETIDLTRDVLGIPAGTFAWRASDGRVIAMWSLLSEHVQMVAWESFGAGWVSGVIKQLKRSEACEHIADYGHIVMDMAALDYVNVVFHVEWHDIWRAGCRRPIPANRTGLTFDATVRRTAQRPAVGQSWMTFPGEKSHGRRRHMGCYAHVRLNGELCRFSA
jgi:phosphoserine aminotransferase